MATGNSVGASTAPGIRRGAFMGSIVAIVTPMQANGDVDFGRLDALVDWHIESGTHGIVAVGTTGESSTLQVAEHMEVIRRVVRRVNGRAHVIAGTGANATAEAIELTRGAADLGVDACLLVTPYYNKPPQEGLFQHYSAVAAAVNIPQILYNVPGRTACDLQPETIARLAPLPNIVGVKEATGEVSRVTRIRELCGDDFVILSGEDAKNFELMQAGAVGAISVTANVLPREMAQFCTAMLAGRVAEAGEIDARMQPLHAMLFIETSPIPVKYALEHLGRIGPGIRLPLVPMSAANRPALAALVDRLVSARPVDQVPVDPAPVDQGRGA